MIIFKNQRGERSNCFPYSHPQKSTLTIPLIHYQIQTLNYFHISSNKCYMSMIILSLDIGGKNFVGIFNYSKGLTLIVRLR